MGILQQDASASARSSPDTVQNAAYGIEAGAPSRRVSQPNELPFSCGRNARGAHVAANSPTRAAGAKRTRREGSLVATAPVSCNGELDSARASLLRANAEVQVFDKRDET